MPRRVSTEQRRFTRVTEVEEPAGVVQPRGHSPRAKGAALIGLSPGTTSIRGCVRACVRKLLESCRREARRRHLSCKILRHNIAASHVRLRHGRSCGEWPRGVSQCLPRSSTLGRTASIASPPCPPVGCDIIPRCRECTHGFPLLNPGYRVPTQRREPVQQDMEQPKRADTDG